MEMFIEQQATLNKLWGNEEEMSCIRTGNVGGMTASFNIQHTLLLPIS